MGPRLIPLVPPHFDWGPIPRAGAGPGRRNGRADYEGAGWLKRERFPLTVVVTIRYCNRTPHTTRREDRAMPMTAAELKRIRARLGKSQRALADLIGVDRVTVARWETDVRRMPEMAARLVRRLAEPPGRRRRQRSKRKK